MEDIDFHSNDRGLHAESSRNAAQRTGLTLKLPPLKAVKALKGKKSILKVARDSGVQKVPRPIKLKPLKEVLTKLIAQIKRKDDYAFFLTPVDLTQVSGYADLIKNPMDLGTMTTKVERGKYRTLEEFANDLRLVTTNAKLFNPPGSIYSTEADRIEAWSIDHINKAAASVIEFESDWNIDVEHDEMQGTNGMDEDGINGVDKPTPMEVDGSVTRGRSPSVSSTQTPVVGPRRGKGKKQPGVLSESFEDDGHLPGYKDGVGQFPPGTGWAELMLALKIKGKRYRTKKERMRMEKGGPPFTVEGSLDYAEMEDPFTILSAFVPDPPCKPLLTNLSPTSQQPPDPSFPGPVNFPLDSQLPKITTPASTKQPVLRTSSRTVPRRKHWTILRNQPRSRQKDKEEEDIPPWKVPREPHAVDYGSFAILVGKMAEEAASAGAVVDLGSAERLLSAIRSGLEQNMSGGDGLRKDVSPHDETPWESSEKAAGRFLVDAVYGGVDGLAYARSLAEFCQRPQDVEVDPDNPFSKELGMPLARYVEQVALDPLTDGRHGLLCEASRRLHQSGTSTHFTQGDSISDQLNRSLHLYPSLLSSLHLLKTVSFQKLDMTSLLHRPEELFLADTVWAGKKYMDALQVEWERAKIKVEGDKKRIEEEKKRLEEERERQLLESPADYLAFAIKTHKEAEEMDLSGPETNGVRFGAFGGSGKAIVYETREALRYALGYAADMIADLSNGRPPRDPPPVPFGKEEEEEEEEEDPMDVDEIAHLPPPKVQSSEHFSTLDVTTVKREDDLHLTLNGFKSPNDDGEDPTLKKLRYNLLALAKRAPLDAIAKLPAHLVPSHIRDVVPTL